MKILALEFSSSQRSVAILETALNIAPVLRSSAQQTGPEPTAMIGLVDRALQQAGLEREAIELIAIGLGPGSYTGIRLAIALAQGWQLALEVRLVGISSVDCLAAQAQAAGWLGRVHFVIDAHRHEFYQAGYEIQPACCQVVEPLRILSAEAMKALIPAGDILAGPDLPSWISVARPLLPNAETLARLAATRTDFVAGYQLEPIYLRPANFVKSPPPRVVPER